MQGKEQLRSLPLFSKLTAEEMAAVFAEGEELAVAAGSFVYQHGDDGNYFYVVLDGEVELIARGPNNRSSTVGKIGPGGHLGESALLTGESRSICVRAVSPVSLIRFTREFFYSTLLANPDFHLELDRILATRLRLAFKDQVDIVHDRRQSLRIRPGGTAVHPLINIGTTDDGTGKEEEPSIEGPSRPVRDIQRGIRSFAANLEPVVITGESGTGRRLAAKEIHLYSDYKQGAYIEIDLRQFDAGLWEGKIFGHERDAFPFSQIRQTGILEQFRGGTVVFFHAETMSETVQHRLLTAMTHGFFKRVAGRTEIMLGARLIFICEDTAADSAPCLFIPGLQELLCRHVLAMPPLRDHKRDISRLVQHYLQHFNREYNRAVERISANALGVLMNYDWPGNMTELANVVQRAVILAEKDEILSEQILLGLPQPEGKLEYNLLRWPFLRNIFQSRLFPLLPRLVISVLFVGGLFALFLGPENPEQNIGLVMSWAIGWPLLLFSFFFLGRIWCSICSFSLPGNLVQMLVKPQRSVPRLLVSCSGWIMAFTCILIFWVELVWDAYRNARLTGFIVLAITLGAFLFSMIYKRRAWCRYICPLGGLNAIFAMPSVMELRANHHLCINSCQEHSCYKGGEELEGCPMFRHPFLVDNNRDCTLCANCIKNCPYNSIQVNLRIAPQELWLIQSPRVADSFLILALAALFFPLARHQQFLGIMAGYPSPHLAGSLLILGLIGLAVGGYSLYSWLQAGLTRTACKTVFAATGYGLIPLVLGAFLAVYFEMFIAGSWRFVPLLVSPFVEVPLPPDYRFLSRDATATLQHLIIIGGMLAALYATFRIVKRYTRTESFSLRLYGLAYGFLACLGILFLLTI